MTYRQKASLYKDRIFGDDETPPRLAAAAKPKPNSQDEDELPFWFSSNMSSTTTNNKSSASKSGGLYPLGRDALASARLSLQHTLWLSCLGFLVHPGVPIHKPDLLVADIGCGNGVWTLDMAERVQASGGKVEAFDLSLAQAPHKAWWPENASFSELDIFDPIPKGLQNRYDVVHVRLLILVVQAGDPMPLLRNLMKLLKPGGYLHWQEYDTNSNKILLADPKTMVAPKMEALIKSSSRGDADRWVDTMHTRFGEVGGELMAYQTDHVGKKEMLLKQDMLCLSVREWAAGIRSRDPESGEAALYDRMGSDFEEECWSLGRGACVDTGMVTWVVRKM